MRYRVLIVTSILTQVQRATGYDYREKLMYKLSQAGMTNKQIVEYLTREGMRPKRVSNFSVKLVWSILEKYRKKLRRKTELRIKIECI